MSFWRAVEKTSEMGAAYSWVQLGIVISGLIIGLLDPKARLRMRNAILFLAISFIACLLGAALLHAGASDRAWSYVMLRFLAVFIEVVAVVNLASVVIFDGILGSIRLRPPQIAQDLIIAVAYVAVALALMAQAGVDLRGIVATSAVLTAVIGFSLQDALGNVMGGLALQLERTIRSGDWIRVDDLEGRVKEIRWRQTSIETRNWDTVVIPNNALTKSKVTLLGRRTSEPMQRRQWIHFHVSLDFSPTRVIEVAETALKAEPIPFVAESPAMHCIVTDVKNGDASYAVRYWLTDFSTGDATDSLIRTRIYAALRRSSIPLSLPSQSIILTEERIQRKRQDAEELEQRVKALQSLQFFQPFNDAERDQLASALVPAPFVKGEAMTRQGAQANWLYIIVEGEAEVRVSVDGYAKKVATLHKGDYFGEMALMTGEPRTATVLALTDVKCYRLGKESFEAILHRRPELATQISETLAQRRVELEAVKEELSQDAFRERMLSTQGALLRRIRDFFGLANERAA